MRRFAVVLLLGLVLGGCGDNIAPSTPPPTPTPPAALSPDLTTALRRDSEGLVVETAADGSQKLNLQGRFRSVLVAQRNPDGTISITSANDQTTGPTTPRTREFK